MSICFKFFIYFNIDKKGGEEKKTWAALEIIKGLSNNF